MSSMEHKMASVDRIMHTAPVIAVLVVHYVVTAVSMSRALAAGGLPVL